jgi:Zn-dependent protease
MIWIVRDLFEIDAFAGLVLFSAIISALILGISFHEFSHAYIADTLGDGLPRRMGRVTLNPLAHLEPLGTILMLLVGIGWGRPVPVNPYNTRNPKAALGLTAAAGPLSNFVVAAVAGLPIKLDLVPWSSPFNDLNALALSRNGWELSEYLSVYLSAIVLFSLILGVFNLIPIAPLDGFKVAVGFLPDELSQSFAKLERYGPIILITLFVLPFFTGTFLLFEVMEPVIQLLGRLFAGVEGDVFVS